jgi:hypothetical protein
MWNILFDCIFCLQNEGEDSLIAKGAFGGAFGKIKAAKQELLLKSLQAEDTEEQKNMEKKFALKPRP